MKIMLVAPIGYNENNIGFKAKFGNIIIKEETANAIKQLIDGLKPIETFHGTERIPVGENCAYYEQIMDNYILRTKGNNLYVTLDTDKKIKGISYITEHKNKNGDIFIKTLGISRGRSGKVKQEPSIEFSKHIIDSQTCRRIQKNVYKPGSTVSDADNYQITTMINFLTKLIGIK